MIGFMIRFTIRFTITSINDLRGKDEPLWVSDNVIVQHVPRRTVVACEIMLASASSFGA